MTLTVRAMLSTAGVKNFRSVEKNEIINNKNIINVGFVSTGIDFRQQSKDVNFLFIELYKTSNIYKILLVFLFKLGQF